MSGLNWKRKFNKNMSREFGEMCLSVLDLCNDIILDNSAILYMSNRPFLVQSFLSLLSSDKKTPVLVLSFIWRRVTCVVQLLRNRCSGFFHFTFNYFWKITNKNYKFKFMNNSLF